MNEFIFIGSGGVADKILINWINSQYKYILKAVLDNNKTKWGTIYNNVEIDNVENIKKYISEKSVILIASSYYQEISVQLNELGVINYFTFEEYETLFNKNILNNNKKLVENKNKDRVFIVGNGPSLKGIDLDLIKNEDTILVSHIYRSKELLSLNPNYWVVADPTFWDSKEDFLRVINETLTTKLQNTKFLLNLDAKYTSIFVNFFKNDNVSLYSLDPCKDYLYSSEKIDFKNKIPRFAQNVMSVCLMLALFLEYKEVILIGCDHSWWAYSKEEIEKGKIHSHFYQDTTKQIKLNKNVFEDYGYKGLLKTIKRQKYEYAQLKRYAYQNNINIINATVGGNLECFERRDFNSFFEGI
ncbi:DUF115 domain-containing protein [Lysinibacillus fusiformis]|uniref:6-hydroxymethylpterin diphosphokinase MptE-like protein n=1 Tax=Lysinibacillus fusiformis TaxID=28031 RepID=UPI001F4E0009|nr:6-hydroxymethylpterin diphosphokinase MptE-like protein [Lysinibacillus fusiformis]MCK1986503.1 DUF115 domain-containing protein [Lysinibacillus fusiformis]